MHSSARPYACAVCGKAFKLRKYLASHETTHARGGASGGAVTPGGASGDPAVPSGAAGGPGAASDVAAAVCTQLLQPAPDVTDRYQSGVDGGHQATPPAEDSRAAAVVGIDRQAALYDGGGELSEQSVCVAGEEGEDGEARGVVAGEEGEDEEAVQMYMCGTCHTVYPSLDDVQGHMLLHEAGGRALDTPSPPDSEG